MTLIRGRLSQARFAFGFLALISLGISGAQAECKGRWDLSGKWRFSQSNGYAVDFELKESGGSITGSGSYDYPAPPKKGIGAQFTPTYDVGQVGGVLTGSVLSFSITWNSGAIGEYAGTVKEDGFLSGMTYDRAHPENSASWTSDRAANCKVAKKLVPKTGATKPVGPVKTKKLVPKADATATVTADVDVYDTPGGEGEVVGMLREGAQVSAACRDDRWCAVSGDVPPNGKGWVWGEFLAF